MNKRIVWSNNAKELGYVSRRREDQKKKRKERKSRTRDRDGGWGGGGGDLCRYHIAIKIVTSILLQIEQISLLIHICHSRLIFYLLSGETYSVSSLLRVCEHCIRFLFPRCCQYCVFAAEESTGRRDTISLTAHKDRSIQSF